MAEKHSKSDAAEKAAGKKDSKKGEDVSQKEGIAMPEPQTASGHIYHTDPGEEPVYVGPGDTPPDEKDAPKESLSLEKRVERIETALLRATGINLEEYPVY